MQENDTMPYKDAERLTCLSAIAVEYGILGELERSASFSQQVLNDAYYSLIGKNAVLLNYCATLLKQKHILKH